MNGITKGVREVGVKQLLFADNLLLLEKLLGKSGNNKCTIEKVTMKKGLKVNAKKTKALLSWLENCSNGNFHAQCVKEGCFHD